MTVTIQEWTPLFDPVDLTTIKAWCRVDDAADDTTLVALIDASVNRIEQLIGHRLAQRTVTIGFDCLCDIMALPITPVSAITEISYLDFGRTRQTLSPATYVATVNTLSPRITRAALQFYPIHLTQPDSVLITATVGYATAEAIPAALKQAVAISVSDLFSNREGNNTGEATIGCLVAPYRMAWTG
jgi:uncharacterized phiE125 gp8 family phage protein